MTASTMGPVLGSINVEGLHRSYRRPDRKQGLRHAVRHLVRPVYKEITAVSGLDLAVTPGECVGYVGPNGAGKSTTIKILAGVIRPTAGHVRVNGLDPAHRRMENAARIGVVWGQRQHLWWDLPLDESLNALGAIYKLEPVRFSRSRARLVELLELGDLLSAPIRQMSLGQRTRANICASLIHEPHVLFLDEPTIGLDVFIKERVREALRELRSAQGTTILLTSHDLTDVEQLCERLVVLDEGRIVHDGPLQEAVRRFARNRVLKVTTRLPCDPTALAGSPVEMVQQAPHQLAITFDEGVIPVPQLVSAVMSTYEVTDLVMDSPSIEDALRSVAAEGRR